MSTSELILSLEELGIHLILKNGKLKINAPKGALNDDLINKVKQNKKEILEILNHKELQEKYDCIKQTKTKNFYKLSSAQKRLFFLFELDKTSLAYNIPKIVKLEGKLDKLRLNNAFRKLIDRHENLRTSFEVINDEVVQKISNQVEFEIEYYHSDKNGVQSIIKNFIKPFDLEKAPLIKVGLIEIQSQENLLMIDMHHIITDGVSQGILIKDFSALYNNVELPDLKLQYKDYSEWQQSEEQKEIVSKQKTFWLNEFAEEITILELPTDYPRPKVKNYEGNIISFAINTEESTKLKAISETNRSTLYTTLLSIYNILLSKLSNQNDIVIGTIVAGRQHADLESVIGMFVNTLALRNFPKAELSFKEFVSELKSKTLECFDNQSYQYEELLNELNVVRDTSRNPMFDVMFLFQNFERKELKISDFKLNSYNSGHTTSKFDLTLSGGESHGQIILSFDYSTYLFKKETIERFITYFKNIVSAVINDQNKKISDIDIISDEEKSQLLYEFNNTKADYPKEKTIIQLFEEQVVKAPNRVAVVFNGNNLTYCEINNKANQLGRLLQKKGVIRNSVVGVMIERSLEMFIGIYGILKARGAYLPIATNYPENRKKYMIENSKATILLTQENLLNNIEGGLELINPYDKNIYQGNIDNLNLNAPDDLAYVIYTSGSTGNPKGVMIEHGSLVNRLNWMQKMYPIDGKGTILQKTPFTFDVSVWEIFWWSMTGSKICLLKLGGEKEPETIIKTIEKNIVSVLHFVPSMFGVFLDHIITEEGQLKKIKSIKQVITSGEALQPIHVEKFNRTLGNVNGSKLANLYGPTEATVDVTYYNCPEDESVNIVPIGKPIDNTSMYIIDSSVNLTPIGVGGELCIGGVGLAQGYLNNEELTKEKFILSSFAEGRLYRTGDLARWLPDGNIEYLGRIDHQIKIRGNRLELGEIESNLIKHEKISETVVIAVNEGVEKRICAYFVSNEEIEISELRTYLSQSLLDYMIPSYFVRLNVMPLTSNGKIDRKALPEPEFEVGDAYVRPRNDLEFKLCEIWGDILGINKDEISTHVDFFNIGGNSLQIIKLVSQIKNVIETNLTVLDVFHEPTIKAISHRIKNKVVETSINNTPYIRYNRNSKRNVFCFPPIAGLGLWCSALAPYMQDFTIISFNFVNKENLVEYYTNIIATDFPSSDIVLMGYSMGGNLAYEVAKELELRNINVSDVIIIDCFKNTKERKEYINSLPKSNYEEMGIFNVLKVNKMDHLKEKLLSNVLEYDNYHCKKLASDFIEANIHYIYTNLSDNKNWRPSTKRQFIEYKGVGVHLEMWTAPNLKANAELLNKILINIEF
ncbi:MAG: amino acid adenylation domain-containing protein [Bacteroidales bacterium]|nr:amino acid adenylation domain-containing protein [Bacteroidales bacterium]